MVHHRQYNHPKLFKRIKNNGQAYLKKLTKPTFPNNKRIIKNKLRNIFRSKTQIINFHSRLEVSSKVQTTMYSTDLDPQLANIVFWQHIICQFRVFVYLRISHEFSDIASKFWQQNLFPPRVTAQKFSYIEDTSFVSYPCTWFVFMLPDIVWVIRHDFYLWEVNSEEKTTPDHKYFMRVHYFQAVSLNSCEMNAIWAGVCCMRGKTNRAYFGNFRCHKDKIDYQIFA